MRKKRPAMGAVPSAPSQVRSPLTSLRWRHRMQRCSESIGAIASALAKAQAKLENPQKTLTAIIHSPFPREESRTFRYASLASGLDIVRKALSQHEIATVQTTAVDQDAGLIRLTTVLAHSSGEWVSSEWPVCPVTETASPQRMGTALTYARRYALFTLVGIAGEDDLDAPDLATSLRGEPQASRSVEVNGAPVLPSANPAGFTPRKPVPRPVRPTVPRAESAALRAQLEAELVGAGASEEALAWAQRTLPTKNTLTTEDAGALERAFEAKMAAVGADEASEPASAASQDQKTEPAPHQRAQRVPIQKAPALKSRRRRDKKHLEYVATKPCLVCGRAPSDAHHLRYAEPRALGRKVSDEFAVPLCRIHHRELHDRGDKKSWWQGFSIDPSLIAEQFWSETR